ncbi:MAG: hypothetical protein ACRD0L_14285 [Acidimicrobiales bacterium]
MHPIERLRYVARAGGAPPSSLVREAAGALAGFADEPAALVTACRRLVDRHPQVGPMWWLASRMLSASDPTAEAWRSADELDGDPTAGCLAAELPESAAVVVLGWPELVGSALRRRGDLAVFLVDALGDGSGLARRLRSGGGDVVDIPEAGLAQAVSSADVVLVEALALGRGRRDGSEPRDGPHDGAVAVAGSWAAAAVARSAGVPMWLVAGVGRVLPARLWEAMARRLDDDPDEPWDRAWEVLPLDLVDQVVGPAGPESADDALRRADCPVVPELLRPMGA